MTAPALAERLATHDCLLLVTHRHANRDGLGSAIALAETLDADTEICLPDGARSPAKPLLDGRELLTDPPLAAYD